MTYFWILTGPDGTYISQGSKEEAREAVEEFSEGGGYASILSRMPDSGTNDWGESLLIIKGEIVAPKPVEVVTRYELD